MGEFPSGQRGQTVNLLAVPSVVRIHLPPFHRGVEQLVARRAHNPKVEGSSPSSATSKNPVFLRVLRNDTGFSFCLKTQNGKHLVNILQIFLFSAISGLLPGRCRRSCFLRSRSPDRETVTFQNGVTTIHLQTYTRMIHPVPFWKDQKTSCILCPEYDPHKV